MKEDKLNFRESYKTLKSPVLAISGDHNISFRKLVSVVEKCTYNAAYYFE